MKNRISIQIFNPTALVVLLLSLMGACQNKMSSVEIFETAANGNKLSPKTIQTVSEQALQINILPDRTFQTITGFGGSFTQSTAYLLAHLSEANRDKILQAYFGPDGARYSLTRTHINSCDFSLYQYAYDTIPGDTNLTHFSIAEDEKLLIPMIKAAQKVSKDGFHIIASPWTAPPWMKDNQKWVGGKLLPEYYQTWALYFSRYFKAYQKHNINFWGITVENEPHGNGNNWESMLFSPKEMTDFVEFHLGPRLEKDGYGNIKILGYDQNRDGLKEWVDEMYRSPGSSKYYAGTAIHWYESTFDYFGDALQYAHKKAPGKHLINTEACIDAEVPAWKDDSWYWSKEATDWGWDWAPENQKHLHPKYVPVFRYARDIIGCLNHHVDGWIDWNMVLDRQGGPNWFKNWCTAPVVVDTTANEVYVTPLYYTLAHFSKFIRPGAVRVGFQNSDPDLMSTATRNPDGSIAVVLFNPTDTDREVALNLHGNSVGTRISAKAIQTILIK